MTTKPDPSLEQTLPEGQLVNRAWLLSRGFNRSRVDYFLRARKLVSVAHGIYRRPGPPLKWEPVVYSLNEMDVAVRVGGRSALELQGMAHYLPMGDEQRIDLYGSAKVPAWVRGFKRPFRFYIHTQRLFDQLPEAAVHHQPFGAWDWPIRYSTPELATVELMAGVHDQADFFWRVRIHLAHLDEIGIAYDKSPLDRKTASVQSKEGTDSSGAADLKQEDDS